MGSEQLVAELPTGGTSSPETSVGLMDRVKFVVARTFLIGWARCFSLKGLYLFGQLFGTCEWLIDFRRRRRFANRLRAVLGQDLSGGYVRRMTLRYFRRVRCDKMVYLIFDKLPREKILKRCKFHGREHLDEALKRGKGVYVTMAHFGAHHVSGLLMALAGYRVAGVRDRREGALRRYMQQRYAESFPEFRAIKVFFADAFPRDLYRCFRSNHVLGTALDVDRQRGVNLRTERVKMFGEAGDFLTCGMRIVRRCGSAIVQGFRVSPKNYSFRLVVSGPLVDPDSQRDEPAVLARVMQKYADGVERQIRAYPCHMSKL